MGIIKYKDLTYGAGGGGGASSESIAPIESSTTASKAYAVGDLLFYNNILYKVTSAISQGGTITISGNNTNVSETDIDSELKTKVKLSSTAGLLKNDGTVDTTTYVSDISGKADKVASATNGDIAKLDSSGNLVDSGIASTDVVVKSATAGLLKNDGTVDTTTTGAVSENTSAISAIKDGSTIDSFGDVETALAGKANETSSFSDASTRTNIASGDTIPTILGKIKKWFTDLADLAFIAKDGDNSTKYLRGDGTWQSFPSFSTSLSGLTDTTITSAANKDILEYNTTSEKWENKKKFTALTGTLGAGETELEFTNAAITATARFETYTEDIYLPLLDIVRDNTTLTLTFPEQEDDVNVKVLIYED